MTPAPQYPEPWLAYDQPHQAVDAVATHCDEPTAQLMATLLARRARPCGLCGFAIPAAYYVIAYGSN